MSALLTYRSRDSFESRFGRKPQLGTGAGTIMSVATPPESPKPPLADEMLAAHNDGHKNAKPRVKASPTFEGEPQAQGAITPKSKPSVFSAQSYLRHQGDKFTARFDANCYIHITRKMDTHDVARGRCVGDTDSVALGKVLSTLPPRALVISIQTDGLFTTSEQRELAAYIPDAELVVIPSPDGHDGFLLEFEQINRHILRFLKREFPTLFESDDGPGEVEGFEVKKDSVFGEAEVDITSW
jgi:homoserine O-acetyltransferase/O-succinyltransferase